MRILYAVGSWGLGHATRSLPLIAGLLDAGATLTVVSTGRALLLLRAELGRRCDFLDWPDVPQPIGRGAAEFHARAAAAIPWFLRSMSRERGLTAALVRSQPIDRIVSDNRYGVQHPGVASFHVAHGLRFLAPWRWRLAERALEAFNYRWFAGLRRVLVPDTPEDGLSGDLAHRLAVFPPSLLAYVGILSSVRARSLPQDIDIFITLSGPEPQRSRLEQRVLGQLRAGGGAKRIVVALGRPESPHGERVAGGAVYGYLDRRAQEEMINRARVVVARAGYSTVMELAEVERRAVLIPTPGQTEQEHLAQRHHRRGAVWASAQDQMELDRDVAEASSRPGLRAGTKTAEAVRRSVALIMAG